MAASNRLGGGHGSLQRAGTDPVNRIGREPVHQALHGLVAFRSQLYIWQASGQDGTQRLAMSVSNQENSTHTVLTQYSPQRKGKTNSLPHRNNVRHMVP
jgi:hypothetical protein